MPVLTSLPPEVIADHILPFLKWNDLLRFRRVCKLTKSVVQGYLRVHPELAPEIEIDEDAKNIVAFLEMDIPSNKIYLNNPSGREFFTTNKAHIKRFLTHLGPVIESLKVAQLSMFLYGDELQFLNSLVNLSSLEVGYLGYGNKKRATPRYLMKTGTVSMRRVSEEDRSNYFRREIRVIPVLDVEWYSIPRMVTQLKVLKIGQQKKIWDPVRRYIDTTGYLYLESVNSDWRHVCVPFTTLQTGYLLSVMNAINIYLERRVLRSPLNSGFRVIDFVNFHEEHVPEDVHWKASKEFLELCRVCIKDGVRLQNVSSSWFIQCSERLGMSPDLGSPVSSLLNLSPWILSLNMPNLERVQVQTSTSGVGDRWREERPHWPALKVVDFTVDSRISESRRVQCRIPPDGFVVHSTESSTETLFHFFFKDIVRPQVVQLHLKFTKDAGSVAIPKTEDIVDSCPNLKHLTLVNWPGTNKALVKLWAGLPGLEEVSLEYCAGLGNLAFVGENSEKPVFLKLPKLRKLTLKGLDKMPKITDSFFSLVIRHLELSHLSITSDAPIKSITLSGVRSLLPGKFAQSIETFRFQGWSLAGVSDKQFEQLEKQFRAYYLL